MKIADVDNYDAMVHMPKILLDKKTFPDLSYDSAFLYAFLSNRKNNSILKNIVNKNGVPFVYFKKDGFLDWGRKRIEKCLNSLIAHNFLSVEKTENFYADKYYIKPIVKNNNIIYKEEDKKSNSFIQLPLAIFIEKSLKKEVSIDAAILYSFLRDIVLGSDKNGFVDENGENFTMIKNKEIADYFGWSERKVITVLNNLRDLVFIKTIRNGGKLNLRSIYVYSHRQILLNLIYFEDENENPNAITTTNDSNQTAEILEVQNNEEVVNLEVQESTGVSAKLSTGKCKKVRPKVQESTLSNTHSSKTYVSKTYFSNGNTSVDLESSSNTNNNISEEDILKTINSLPDQVTRILDNSHFDSLSTVNWLIQNTLFENKKVDSKILEWFIDEKLKLSFYEYYWNELFENGSETKLSFDFKLKEIKILKTFFTNVLMNDKNIKNYLGDDFEFVYFKFINNNFDIKPFIEMMCLYSSKILDLKSYTIKSFVQQLKDGLI